MLVVRGTFLVLHRPLFILHKDLEFALSVVYECITRSGNATGTMNSMQDMVKVGHDLGPMIYRAE